MPNRSIANMVASRRDGRVINAMLVFGKGQLPPRLPSMLDGCVVSLLTLCSRVGQFNRPPLSSPSPSRRIGHGLLFIQSVINMLDLDAKFMGMLDDFFRQLGLVYSVQDIHMRLDVSGRGRNCWKPLQGLRMELESCLCLSNCISMAGSDSTSMFLLFLKKNTKIPTKKNFLFHFAHCASSSMVLTYRKEKEKTSNQKKKLPSLPLCCLSFHNQSYSS